MQRRGRRKASRVVLVVLVSVFMVFSGIPINALDAIAEEMGIAARGPVVSDASMGETQPAGAKPASTPNGGDPAPAKTAPADPAPSDPGDLGTEQLTPAQPGPDQSGSSVEKPVAAPAGDTSGVQPESTPQPDPSAKTEDKLQSDARNLRSTFTYEDDAVKVTATLIDPTVLPKGARFQVTQVTQGGKDYNYDAYMQALNASANKSDAYSDKNTLLYDVAFLATDESGKTIEVQPSKDSVQVSFEFKRDQLADQLDAKRAADVDVTHLPLADSAKKATDTTAQATGISKDDVVVESLPDADVNASGTNNITMKVDGFSVYAFSYTVDFTYGDYTYSIAGESNVRLSELFQILGINANVAHVKNVTFSNPELVKVEQQGEDWLLTSLKPFTSNETLTVEMASGAKYVVSVTDAQTNVQITFYESDGTTVDTGATLDARYYMAVRDWQGCHALAEILPVNGVATLSLGDVDGQPTLVKYTGSDELTKEYVDANWNWDSTGKMSHPTDLLGVYSLGAPAQDGGTYSYRAVKQPAYEVEIVFEGGAASNIGSGYSVYASVNANNQNGQSVTYYDKQDVTLNGVTSKTLTFTSFGRNNDNPNTHSYQTGDEVNVVLGKDIEVEANGDERGTIKSGARVKDGDVIGGFVVSVTSTTEKTTYTFSKPVPYKYSIKESTNNPIAFDSAYQNNWYLLSTLTKSGGGTYYYVTLANLNGSAAIPPSGTAEIATYYTADSNNIGNIQIGNESSTGNIASSVYQTGDQVVNELVHVTSPAQNYKQIVNGDNNGRESFGNGSVANKYIVATSDENGVGTISLTPVPNLKIKTVFKDTAGNQITGSLPTDYKLLVKMVRDGETYYALHAVDTTSNPSSESSPIVFYKYTESNGSGTLDTTNPYYFSGVEGETISTQVVTGADSLTSDLIQHKVSGAVFYNENTVGGTQGSDLTRDLYSTSSSISEDSADRVMTTEFVKQSDNGVPHEIKVSYYKQHASSVSEGQLNPDANNMSTETGAYFFRVRLYNNNKLVAYKIVPLTAEEAAQANSTGTLTHTIGANETFQLVDDEGADIQGGALHYDPTVYTSNVRLYKANTANDLPSNLSEVSEKGSDTIDGYDFWQNVYSETKDGETITKTNTDLALYSAYKKKYQVKIVIDDEAEPKTEDDIRLSVEAAHKTTNVDKFNVNDIANGAAYRTDDVADGKRVITYLVENQTAIPIEQHWTQKGSDSNVLTGNETFSLGLQQGSNGKQSEGYPVIIAGNPYNVSYDTGDAVDKNIEMDDSGKVTTITHYVYLTKADYEPALTPEQVLGDAYEFGVVADTYKQSGHTETNFAVKHYNHGTNFDIEGTSGPYSDVPFYIGEMQTGFIVGSGTNANLYVYTPQSEIDRWSGTNQIRQENIGKERHQVTFTDTPVDEINAYVDGMIDAVRQTSTTMAQKTTLKPATVTSGKPVIDTTSLPDGKTIYVDCSNIVDKIAEGNEWEIHKKDNQTIVLNIPSTGHVRIGKFKVWTDTYPNGVESTTVATNRDDEHNIAVDNAIFGHVFFNMPNASSVHTEEASAMFLAPNASEFTQNNGAGWIVCGGTVDSGAEWHFYRHNRHFSSTVGSLQINKKLNDGAPAEAKQKAYKFYIREKNEDNSYIYYYNNPNPPVEGEPYNPVNSSSDPVEIEITGSGCYKLEKLEPPKDLEVVELEDGREIAGYALQVTGETTTSIAGGRTKYVNVTNTYTKVDGPTGNATLKAAKALGDKNTWPANGKVSFSIARQAGGGNANAPLPSSLNTEELTAAGEVSFGAITYTAEDAGKTYYYEITEKSTNFSTDWASSPSKIIAKVVVDAANDLDGGKLKTTVSYSVDGTSYGIAAKDYTITNTYTAPAEEKGSLIVKKSWSGDLPEASRPDVSFTVAGPDNFNATKKLSEFENGSWSLADLKLGEYTVTESGEGVTGYDVTTSYSVSGGKATLSKDNKSAEVVVTNSYAKQQAGTATLGVKKQIKGNAGYKTDEKFAFKLEAESALDSDGEAIAQASIPMPSGAGNTVEATAGANNAAGEAACFGAISYERTGTYYYKITEQAPDSDHRTVGMTYNENSYWAKVTVENLCARAHSRSYGSSDAMRRAAARAVGLLESRHIATWEDHRPLRNSMMSSLAL